MPERPPDLAVVVPTIREAQIRTFLERWRFDRMGARVIVVEDNPEPTFALPYGEHYSWQDIERDLGADSWIIPRRSDCVRSYGYWQAWRGGQELLLTLDDDCYPLDGAAETVANHALNLCPQSVDAWYSTLVTPFPRGVPYEQTRRAVPVALSHGLWEHIIDYDAISQLVLGRVPHAVEYRTGLVPRGQYFPMCGMNVMLWREVIPAFYFLLMGEDARGRRHGFDRFGDIWCGVLLKRVADHLGAAVHSGQPHIHHARASNVWANLERERAGLAENERVWLAADAVRLHHDDWARCYRELAGGLPLESDYWRLTRRAMQTWAGLF